MTRKPSAEERRFIAEAAQALEYPSFITKVTNLVGRPLEWSLTKIPTVHQETIAKASRTALEKALGYSIKSLGNEPKILEQGDILSAIKSNKKTRFNHLAASAVTGAMGGTMGLPGLVLELPITTTVMLRSIAKTARDFGENIQSAEAQVQCLSIFAFGRPNTMTDDAMESSYYATRLMLAEAMRNATKYISQRSATELLTAMRGKSAPILIELLIKIAARFEFVVAEKALVAAIPIVGALGGALVNSAFTGHFTDVARHHFGLRQLEATLGQDEVRAIYQEAIRTGSA